MAGTPITTFRLDEATKARLAQLAKERGKNMTQVITDLIEDAANETGIVAITGVDTVPECDHFVNLAGHSTTTKLRIDPARREAYVYQDQRTNSTLMTIYHGVELEYGVYDHPDEEELGDWLMEGEGQELLRRICNGHEEVWDGSNWRGRLTDDAIAAIEELEDELSNFDNKYSFWDAGDWLYPGAEQRVTARTSDEELAEIAKEFEATAEAENVVLDEDILKWLTRYRDGLWDDEEG